MSREYARTWLSEPCQHVKVGRIQGSPFVLNTKSIRHSLHGACARHYRDRMMTKYCLSLVLFPVAHR